MARGAPTGNIYPHEWPGFFFVDDVELPYVFRDTEIPLGYVESIPAMFRLEAARARERLDLVLRDRERLLHAIRGLSPIEQETLVRRISSDLDFDAEKWIKVIDSNHPTLFYRDNSYFGRPLLKYEPLDGLAVSIDDALKVIDRLLPPPLDCSIYDEWLKKPLDESWLIDLQNLWLGKLVSNVETHDEYLKDRDYFVHSSQDPQEFERSLRHAVAQYAIAVELIANNIKWRFASDSYIDDSIFPKGVISLLPDVLGGEPEVRSAERDEWAQLLAAVVMTGKVVHRGEPVLLVPESVHERLQRYKELACRSPHVAEPPAGEVFVDKLIETLAPIDHGFGHGMSFELSDFTLEKTIESLQSGLNSEERQPVTEEVAKNQLDALRELSVGVIHRMGSSWRLVRYASELLKDPATAADVRVEAAESLLNICRMRLDRRLEAGVLNVAVRIPGVNPRPLVNFYRRYLSGTPDELTNALTVAGESGNHWARFALAFTGRAANDRRDQLRLLTWDRSLSEDDRNLARDFLVLHHLERLEIKDALSLGSPVMSEWSSSFDDLGSSCSLYRNDIAKVAERVRATMHPNVGNNEFSGDDLRGSAVVGLLSLFDEQTNSFGIQQSRTRMRSTNSADVATEVRSAERAGPNGLEGGWSPER